MQDLLSFFKQDPEEFASIKSNFKKIHDNLMVIALEFQGEKNMSQF